MSAATLLERYRGASEHAEDRFSKKSRRSILAWVLLAPALIIWFLYRGLPFLWNVYLSFFEMAYTGETTFVGVDNFVRMLGDETVLVSIYNTFLFLSGVPIAIGIALGLALLLNQRFPGNRVFRSVFFLPYVTMMVAVAVMWSYMFNTQEGVLNYLLLEMGLITDNISWLTNSFWARISIIVVYVWKTTGFYLIIILAGLQDIPRNVYEVARLDGASVYQRFRYITLPLLRPTMGVCGLIGIVSSFQLFALVMVLTGTGPGDSTEILVTYIYKQAFEYGNFGYGAALSVLLFAIMVGMVGLGRIYQRRTGL